MCQDFNCLRGGEPLYESELHEATKVNHLPPPPPSLLRIFLKNMDSWPGLDPKFLAVGINDVFGYGSESRSSRVQCLFDNTSSSRIVGESTNDDI